MIPRHDQRRRTSGAATHGRPPFGILSELDVVCLLDERQHLCLHELRVSSRHRVVFQAALAALRVAAAVADGDGNHHRHAFLRDQIVEGGEQQLVGSVGADDEWRRCSGNVLFGDIDRHTPCVGGRMAGGDHQPGGIGGLDRAKGPGHPCDARIDLAVRRAHRERRDRALRHAFLHRHLGRRVMRRSDDEVPVGIGRRDGAVGQLLRLNISGRVRIAGWRHGSCGRRLSHRADHDGDRQLCSSHMSRSCVGVVRRLGGEKSRKEQQRQRRRSPSPHRDGLLFRTAAWYHRRRDASGPNDEPDASMEVDGPLRGRSLGLQVVKRPRYAGASDQRPASR